MISQRQFLEEEIPYEKLEKLGIGRKQMLKMPREILREVVAVGLLAIFAYFHHLREIDFSQ